MCLLSCFVGYIIRTIHQDICDLKKKEENTPRIWYRDQDGW